MYSRKIQINVVLLPEKGKDVGSGTECGITYIVSTRIGRTIILFVIAQASSLYSGPMH
jgi:hypothetical protein